MLYFGADVSFTFGEAKSEAKVRHIGFELTEFKFSKPASISGMVITRTEDAFTLEFNGMKQSISEGRPYNDSPAILLSEILEAIQTGEGKASKKRGKDGEASGKVREQEFTIVRDSENNIQEITCEGLSFKAVFTNFVNLESEIGANPITPTANASNSE